MGRKSFEVEVNPEVIKWARESIGLSPQDVAKRLKMSKENYLAIEQGKKLPTYVQLSKLADIFKRPLSALLLPEPPEEPSIELVFRTLPQVERPLSRDNIRLVIREARYLQSIAKELMEALGKSTKPLIGKFRLQDDPVEVAKEERKKLGIDFETQLNWKDVHTALNEWREAVERKNIFVLQESFPIKQARGFLEEGSGFPLMGEPAFIVLNIRDNPTARIFTLFHEYAHLLLREAESFPAVAETEQAKPQLINERKKIEYWCNVFASELLVPAERLLRESDASAILLKRQIDLPRVLEACKGLAKKFKVSSKAILTKLRRLNIIDEEIYQDAYQRLEVGEFWIWRRRKDPIERTLSRRGTSLVRLIMEAHAEKLITTADFLELLSLKLEHLSKPSFYKLLDTSK
jgi:Zn-dependent peptidase ImmA (M78 family)/DNA-binding XRE family transcriptional regulator